MTHSSRHSGRTTEKSSMMWTSNVLNTIVGRSNNAATTSSKLSNVRYSTIGLHERAMSGRIILPLDVEDTVTCFCRFDLNHFNRLFHQKKKMVFHFISYSFEFSFLLC